MGAHPPTLVGRLIEILLKQAVDDIPVVVGGAILPKQVEKLKELDVLGVFPIGSSLESVVGFFKKLAERKTTVKSQAP